MADSLEWRKRAFDVVTEITKQVITLAAAIVALSITFVKDFATHASASARTFLAVSWAIYVASIIAGIMTLEASAGIQEQAAAKKLEPSINARNLRLLGAIQLGLFLIAIIFTVVAGAIAL